MMKSRWLLGFLLLLWLPPAPAVAQTCRPGETDGALSADGTIRVLTITGSAGTGTGANSLNARVAEARAIGWMPVGNPTNGSAQLWCAVSTTLPIPPTPVNCVLSEWSPWTVAGSPSACVNGQQTVPEQRSRTIITPPSNGGLACEQPLSETRTVTQPCSSTPPPTGNLLMESGWDTVTSATPRCDLPSVLDNGRWNEAGGSSICTGSLPHEADVVSHVKADGPNSLRVTQKPGGINGTDVRVLKRFAPQASLTIIHKMFFDPNFKWAGADFKMHISGAEPAQTVYLNYRGGVDQKHARVCILNSIVDVIFCDNAAAHQVTVGRWYQFATYIVTGSQGRLEVHWRDCGPVGTQAACSAVPWIKLNLTQDAGQPANINSLNNGPAINYFKLDTTYNLGSFITENMAEYYDSFQVYSGFNLGQ